jgi:hypothetical protein
VRPSLSPEDSSRRFSGRGEVISFTCPSVSTRKKGEGCLTSVMRDSLNPEMFDRRGSAVVSTGSFSATEHHEFRSDNDTVMGISRHIRIIDIPAPDRDNRLSGSSFSSPYVRSTFGRKIEGGTNIYSLIRFYPPIYLYCLFYSYTPILGDRWLFGCYTRGVPHSLCSIRLHRRGLTILPTSIPTFFGVDELLTG